MMIHGERETTSASEVSCLLGEVFLTSPEAEGEGNLQQRTKSQRLDANDVKEQLC